MVPGIVAWSCFVAVSARAATAGVSIVDFAFNPSSVTVNVNDSVVWTWIGPTIHTSTSDTGLWDSGILSGSANKFTHVFMATGSFPYHCSVHPFMTGAVTVQGQVRTNVPPTVSITSPTNGATFLAPWTGTVQVMDADSDGTVTNLAFKAGTTLLGNVRNPPANASFTVSNLVAGSYSLTVLATDPARARKILQQSGFASAAAERLVSNADLLASAPTIPAESVGLLL